MTIRNVTTWRVLPRYRGHGMKLWYHVRRISPGSLVMATTPGPMSRQIIGAARTSVLPKGSDIRYLRLFGVTDVQPFLAKSGLSPEPATPPGGEDSAMPSTSPFVVKRLLAADDQFDALWEATADRYDGTNVRTAEIVNWYCFADARFRKTLLGCYHGPVLAGYLVGWVETRHGVRVWSVLDVWPATDATGVFASLAAAAVQEAQADGSDVLQFPILKPSQVQPLDRLGLARYRETCRTDYYWTGPEFPGRLDETGCYLTDAQGDRGV
jgi:hypothetical protein